MSLLTVGKKTLSFLQKHSVKLSVLSLFVFALWCSYIVYYVETGRKNIGRLTRQMIILNEISDHFLKIEQFLENEAFQPAKNSKNILSEHIAEVDSLTNRAASIKIADLSEEMQRLDSLLASLEPGTSINGDTSNADRSHTLIEAFHIVDQAKQKAGFKFGEVGARMDPFWYQLYTIVGISCLLGILLLLLVKKQQHAIQAVKRARNEAENAAHMKSELWAILSHEVRTPLNAVIGMTDMLWETDLDEEQAEYIQILKKGSRKLIEIINDILDYSKLESGHMMLDSKPFDLVEVVEDVFDIVASKATKQRNELLYDLKGNVPVFFIGDAGKIRQIVLNLVENAVKFTEEGEILVQITSPGFKGKYQKLQFSICDTGIGIPKEKMDQLFNSYFQVDASNTRKYGGTGLGLAISKKLVNLMGGKIWAERNKNGEGSTFHFTVELEPADSKSRETQLTTQIDLEGKRILLVNSTPICLTMLKRQCERWGMKPVGFQKYRDAVQYFRKKNTDFDLALIEVRDPDTNGNTLLSKITELTSQSTYPHILLTWANSDLPYKLGGQFDCICYKPLKYRALKRSFFSVLGEKQVARKMLANRWNKQP